jgi:hypothetical protein
MATGDVTTPEPSSARTIPFCVSYCGSASSKLIESR